MSLDAIDRRILDELQRDGAQSAGDVATKLGLSNTTCWRRIRILPVACSANSPCTDESPSETGFIVATIGGMLRSAWTSMIPLLSGRLLLAQISTFVPGKPAMPSLGSSPS